MYFLWTFSWTCHRLTVTVQRWGVAFHLGSIRSAGRRHQNALDQRGGPVCVCRVAQEVPPEALPVGIVHSFLSLLLATEDLNPDGMVVATPRCGFAIPSSRSVGRHPGQVGIGVVLSWVLCPPSWQAEVVGQLKFSPIGLLEQMSSAALRPLVPLGHVFGIKISGQHSSVVRVKRAQTAHPW